MRRLKDDRSILPYILLGILTLGIYNIWYLHHMVQDINEIFREDGKKTPGILVYILLSLVTCGFYAIFWWYRIGDMLSKEVRKRGLNSSISGSFVLICFVLNYFVCGIASYVGIHQVFEALNEIAVDYNSKLYSRTAPESEGTGV